MCGRVCVSVRVSVCACVGMCVNDGKKSTALCVDVAVLCAFCASHLFYSMLLHVKPHVFTRN